MSVGDAGAGKRHDLAPFGDVLLERVPLLRTQRDGIGQDQQGIPGGTPGQELVCGQAPVIEILLAQQFAHVPNVERRGFGLPVPLKVVAHHGCSGKVDSNIDLPIAIQQLFADPGGQRARKFFGQRAEPIECQGGMQFHIAVVCHRRCIVTEGVVCRPVLLAERKPPGLEPVPARIQVHIVVADPKGELHVRRGIDQQFHRGRHPPVLQPGGLVLDGEIRMPSQ